MLRCWRHIKKDEDINVRPIWAAKEERRKREREVGGFMPDWMDANDAVLDLFLRLLLIDRANNQHLFAAVAPQYPS